MSIFNPSIELSEDESIVEKFSISKIYLFVNLLIIEIILFFIVFVVSDNLASLFSNLFSKLKLGDAYNNLNNSNAPSNMFSIFDFNSFDFISTGINIFCIFFMIYFAIYYLWYIPISNVYILTNKRIAVKRGWLSTEIVTYSYEKITDIFVAQSFVDRFLFGMGIIKVDTAGKGQYDMVLENIHNPERLKAKILTIKDEMYKSTNITSIPLRAEE